MVRQSAPPSTHTPLAALPPFPAARARTTSARSSTSNNENHPSPKIKHSSSTTGMAATSRRALGHRDNDGFVTEDEWEERAGRKERRFGTPKGDVNPSGSEGDSRAKKGKGKARISVPPSSTHSHRTPLPPSPPPTQIAAPSNSHTPRRVSRTHIPTPTAITGRTSVSPSPQRPALQRARKRSLAVRASIGSLAGVTAESPNPRAKKQQRSSTPRASASASASSAAAPAPKTERAPRRKSVSVKVKTESSRRKSAPLPRALAAEPSIHPAPPAPASPSDDPLLLVGSGPRPSRRKSSRGPLTADSSFATQSSGLRSPTPRRRLATPLAVSDDDADEIDSLPARSPRLTFSPAPSHSQHNNSPRPFDFSPAASQARRSASPSAGLSVKRPGRERKKSPLVPREEEEEENAEIEDSFDAGPPDDMFAWRPSYGGADDDVQDAQDIFDAAPMLGGLQSDSDNDGNDNGVDLLPTPPTTQPAVLSPSQPPAGEARAAPEPALPASPPPITPLATADPAEEDDTKDGAASPEAPTPAALDAPPEIVKQSPPVEEQEQGPAPTPSPSLAEPSPAPEPAVPAVGALPSPSPVRESSPAAPAAPAAVESDSAALPSSPMRGVVRAESTVPTPASAARSVPASAPLSHHRAPRSASPVVKISSADPRAAARAAAILKLHHDYVEHSTPHSLSPRKSRRGSSAAPPLPADTPLPALLADAEASLLSSSTSSRFEGNSSFAFGSDAQKSFEPRFATPLPPTPKGTGKGKARERTWGIEEWKRLEKAYRAERRSVGEGQKVWETDVARRFLESEEVPEEERCGEWDPEKIKLRVIALARRRFASDNKDTSRRRTSTAPSPRKARATPVPATPSTLAPFSPTPSLLQGSYTPIYPTLPSASTSIQPSALGSTRLAHLAEEGAQPKDTPQKTEQAHPQQPSSTRKLLSFMFSPIFGASPKVAPSPESKACEEPAAEAVEPEREQQNEAEQEEDDAEHAKGVAQAEEAKKAEEAEAPTTSATTPAPPAAPAPPTPAAPATAEHASRPVREASTTSAPREMTSVQRRALAISSPASSTASPAPIEPPRPIRHPGSFWAKYLPTAATAATGATYSATHAERGIPPRKIIPVPPTPPPSRVPAKRKGVPTPNGVRVRKAVRGLELAEDAREREWKRLKMFDRKRSSSGLRNEVRFDDDEEGEVAGENEGEEEKEKESSKRWWWRRS